MLAELYLHNRRRWPRPWTRAFRLHLRDFLGGYLARKFRAPLSRLGRWGVKAVVALAATTRLFNPEHWWAEHFPVATSGPPNRCVTCHVRAGESVTGQVVNTHRFAVPGG